MSEARQPTEGIVPLTAERLRAIAAAPSLVVEFLSITGPEAAMLADALEIADETAQDHVEGETTSIDEEGVSWRDLASIEFDYIDSVMESCRYLDARGILQKHPTNRHLVRFQEIPD